MGAPTSRRSVYESRSTSRVWRTLPKYEPIWTQTFKRCYFNPNVISLLWINALQYYTTMSVLYWIISGHLFSFEVLRDPDVLAVEAVHDNPASVVVSGSSGDVENSGGRVRRLHIVTFNPQITTRCLFKKKACTFNQFIVAMKNISGHKHMSVQSHICTIPLKVFY